MSKKGEDEVAEKEQRKKSTHPVRTFFSVFFVFAGVLIALSVNWALSLFAGLDMTELVFQMTSPLEGTGNGMVGDFIVKCLVPSVACGAGAYILIRVLGQKKPRLHMRMVLFIAGIGVGIFGVVTFDSNVHLVTWIRNRFTNSDFIAENYVYPSTVDISFPEEKRNLILIYLESMEMSYTDKEDGGAFDENMIPELTALAQENEDFSGSDTALNGGYSMPGTTWTMGAMFATSSGLPLSNSVGENSMGNQDSFFPNLTCLGDILEEAGYHQELLVGSNAAFGGRKLFYTDHGGYDIVDYNTAISEQWIPEGYKVWWGFEDEKLFRYAKKQLTELAAGSEPFNFTMLTVDTHFPDGYECRLCGDEFGNYQYGNVLACSSRQVASFVEWIKEQDFYDNTTVVIIGDHPTMDTGTAALISDDYTRYVYTCYMNAAATPEDETRKREFSTFDTFPTIIASLGASIEGERLGLGTNLFSSEDTLSEKFGTEYVSDEVSLNSEFLNELEEPDEHSRKVIKEFENLTPISVSANPATSFVSVTIQDVTQIDPDVSNVQVKLWYFKDQTYYHYTKTATQYADGTFKAATFRLDLSEADELHYQIQIKTGIGTSYIDAGPEGTLTISDENDGTESQESSG